MMLSVPTFAQGPEQEAKPEEEGYKFEIIKELPVTSVKDQNRAGTCWCYSSLGFFEAELLRMGKPEYDFSEMYIVYKTYQDRADRHVRTHGDVSYAEGGAFGDVIYAIKHYGLVPDVEMRAGQMHGDSLTDFSVIRKTDSFSNFGLLYGPESPRAFYLKRGLTWDLYLIM